MLSATISQVQSLDRQYLDFVARTAPVFQQYPQIEPLRHTIFKQILVQRRSVGWKDEFKRWLRPMLRRERTRGPMEPVDVLVFVESDREVISEALLPVYRELMSRGIKSCLLSFGGPADLPPSSLDFRFPAYALEPAWAEGAWAALCEAVGELRHSSLQKTFYHSCAGVRGLLDECDRVLDALRPKVVLAASTQLMGGAAMMVAAGARRTLTLLLQHGILQPFYTPIPADYMLTWGRSSNETLERLNVPAKKLVALGSPRHDLMGRPEDGSARSELLNALSLPERPTFVFFSNGNDLVRNGSAPRECALWLEGMAAEHPNDINVLVKLHPNEDGSLYRDCPHLHVFKGTPDLATTLAGCDWVGSLCSTVLYDALLFKKPVWQFHADGWADLADNWRLGLAKRISSRQELRDMANLMLGEGVERFLDEGLSERVFANHGRAAQAVADFVESRLTSDYGQGLEYS